MTGGERGEQPPERLSDRLARRGKLPLDEVVWLGLAILRELEALHGAGRAHGDLRPELISLAADGDSGRERATLRSVAGLESGEEGQAGPEAVEALSCASPERVLGRELDARSDLWSLGALLYRALLGVPPFGGSDREALAVSITQRSFAAPSSLDPALPGAVDAFFRRALRKDAVERFASAREARAALEELRPVAAASPAPRPLERPAPEGAPEPATEPRLKGALERALIAGAFLSFLGVLVYLNRDAILARLAPPEPEAPPAPVFAPPPLTTAKRIPHVRLPGPEREVSLPLDRPFLMNVWLERCPDCMPSFRAWRDLAEAGSLPELPIVNVAFGRADPAWASQHRVDQTLAFDAGDRLVRPLGISRFTTLLVDASGEVLFVGDPKEPAFLEQLHAAVPR